ncbi:uncharacterized protein N7482_007772 [Penicillium canariense]|uniref:Secreted protein n=1 Tax=Penicillium canariense TaxID=189055 RepID=A0A9W9HZP2_9EURO|nr:uncharacterized protein N7482_007772 [Penicillium canariense]KAJ5160768.1 hypothetical protein N7482_007772 [Penicillium canariense]
MKSFIYILTALLPLASQVAMANPVPSDEFLEERDGNRGDKDRGDKDRWDKHDRPEDKCKVQKPYWYHKYPCDSSETVGQSRVGDTFAPVCKYQNWYKNPKGWWVKEDFKPWRCEVHVPNCP